MAGASSKGRMGGKTKSAHTKKPAKGPMKNNPHKKSSHKKTMKRGMSY